MKLSALWIREWINPDINNTELAEQITMAGLKVENVEPVAGHFTGVVVGKIIECRPHSVIDRLQVTKIDIGRKRWLNILCSADNCRVGLRVAVATIGALLSTDLKIQFSKLYGEKSEGILCSFAELGIVCDYSGIIELPTDAPIGQNVRDYLQLDDETIDISITPNRADCLSLLGIARDIAVFNCMPFVQPVVKTVTPLINDKLSICVDATDACPRYVNRIVKNIDINAITPIWMKEKLRRCGFRSVNAIVDITNFVLLELGQPMHVFDRDCIEGGIIVRYAKKDEVLHLSHSNCVTLSPDTLVIADNNKVLEMAGVFVSTDSSISSSTRNIVLECAFFQPIAIIGPARRHGLHSDSSYRYERGVDPTLQLHAMERATSLLVAICGGQPGPVIDIISATSIITPATITLRRKTLDRIIGHIIPDEKVSDILIRLGFQISRTEVGWNALIPSWRFDMTIEEDLIEEIARVYGYDAIPNVPLRAELTMKIHREEILPLSRAKMLLADQGYQEAITYSFVDPKNQALLYPNQAQVILSNPISQKMSAMRLSLWTGLLNAVIYNQNRQQQRIRLFESGLCFIPDKVANLGIRQDLMLGGIIVGPCFDEHWDHMCRRSVDFYDAKGDLEAILELAGKLNDIEFKAQLHPALHPGQSAAIYLHNEIIGFIGVIHPKLEGQFNLNRRTIVFEILWNKIAWRKIPTVHNTSYFPANRRDISIVVADNIAAADIITECKKVIKNHLISINLFDVYRGKKVKKGFKSLAISLILQDNTRTLKEKEISAIVARCIAALKQQFKASLRN